MAPPGKDREPISGGGPLALAILAGVGIGAALGEPTIGFFIGLAIGLALLLTIWLKDRARMR